MEGEVTDKADATSSFKGRSESCQMSPLMQVLRKLRDGDMAAQTAQAVQL